MDTVSEIFRRVSQSVHYGSLPLIQRGPCGDLEISLGEYEKWYAIEKNTLVSPALHSLFARSCCAFCVADCGQMVVWPLENYTSSYGEFAQRREKSRVTRIPVYTRASREKREKERERGRAQISTIERFANDWDGISMIYPTDSLVKP